MGKLGHRQAPEPQVTPYSRLVLENRCLIVIGPLQHQPWGTSQSGLRSGLHLSREQPGNNYSVLVAHAGWGVVTYTLSGNTVGVRTGTFERTFRDQPLGWQGVWLWGQWGVHFKKLFGRKMGKKHFVSS